MKGVLAIRYTPAGSIYLGHPLLTKFISSNPQPLGVWYSQSNNRKIIYISLEEIPVIGDIYNQENARSKVIRRVFDKTSKF